MSELTESDCSSLKASWKRQSLRPGVRKITSRITLLANIRYTLIAVKVFTVDVRLLAVRCKLRTPYTVLFDQ